MIDHTKMYSRTSQIEARLYELEAMLKKYVQIKSSGTVAEL